MLPNGNLLLKVFLINILHSIVVVLMHKPFTHLHLLPAFLLWIYDSFFRLTIKDLLESEFLQSERLRVELTRPAVDIVDENLSVLPLRLKGQLTKHSQDEAIEFDYNIDEDEPETLASEMVRNLLWAFFLSSLFIIASKIDNRVFKPVSSYRVVKFTWNACFWKW